MLTILSNKIYIPFLSFFVFLGIIFFLEYQKFPHEDSEITFFHVPGDAILISLNTGHKIFIDGGEALNITSKLSKKLPYWSREIDLLIITHTDRDHLFGAVQILREFPVQKVMITGVHHENALTKELHSLLKEKEVSVLFANKIQDFQMGNALFDVVYPITSHLGKNVKKINNSSIVFRMSTPELEFLFTGDIEKETEKEILSSSQKISAEHLKIAHHGSKSSTLHDFLTGVGAKYGYISAHKKNRFHHPHTEILDRLKQKDIEYFVTKDIGDIVVSF